MMAFLALGKAVVSVCCSFRGIVGDPFGSGMLLCSAAQHLLAGRTSGNGKRLEEAAPRVGSPGETRSNSREDTKVGQTRVSVGGSGVSTFNVGLAFGFTLDSFCPLDLESENTA
jgi:hypothetical protein